MTVYNYTAPLRESARYKFPERKPTSQGEPREILGLFEGKWNLADYLSSTVNFFIIHVPVKTINQIKSNLI